MSPSLPPSGAISERNIFQVGELVGTLKHALEMNFPAVWVEGEISNFMAARSGHWYFTLKDDASQIRCAFFRNRNLRTAVPDNGQRVLLKARPSIFTGRGELQLLVEELEDAGAGALHLAFEQLKRRLADEGLFDGSRKKAIPLNPRCIGVLSSPVGAAIHDVLTTLRRRNPLTAVILYPIPVQGSDAPEKIIAALQSAERRQECDVLLLTRGGGSAEDLAAFNDEGLARCIAALQIPIVSAIGHEVDFSITDFVADERSATPTAAAERLSGDQHAWRQQMEYLQRRLQGLVWARMNTERRNLDDWQARLKNQSPQRRLLDRGQWLDDLNARLESAGRKLVTRKRETGSWLSQRLRHASPARRITAEERQIELLRERCSAAMLKILQQRQQRLMFLRERLGALAPDAILQRGYSITWQDGRALRDSADASDAPLRIQLASGELHATVSSPD